MPLTYFRLCIAVHSLENIEQPWHAGVADAAHFMLTCSYLQIEVIEREYGGVMTQKTTGVTGHEPVHTVWGGQHAMFGF